MLKLAAQPVRPHRLLQNHIFYSNLCLPPLQNLQEYWSFETFENLVRQTLWNLVRKPCAQNLVRETLCGPCADSAGPNPHAHKVLIKTGRHIYTFLLIDLFFT